MQAKVEDDVELSSSSGEEEAGGDPQGDQGDRGDGLASSSMASTNSSVSVLPPSTALPPASELGPRSAPAPCPCLRTGCMLIKACCTCSLHPLWVGAGMQL